jgi:hypothetical protein
MTTEKLLKMDGFDEAILGHAQRFDQMFIVYDYVKVIDILRKEHDMSEEEALEYWSYNQLGAWVGESTPAFLLLKNNASDLEW